MADPTAAQAPIPPLATLYDAADGSAMPLPAPLADLYGSFAFPAIAERPWIISNFVASIDGVVAFNDPVPPGQGEISASDRHDRAVMGLLRAVADAVIIGAGSLRAVPRHLWTPEYIFPPLAPAYAEVRATLGKPAHPLNVVVSASGQVDLTLPVFQSAEVPTLLLVSAAAPALDQAGLGPHARIETITPRAEGDLAARAIVEATTAAIVNLAPVRGAGQPQILVEGGPRLLGRFVAERALDEQFLTIAPQLVGRDDQYHRPGLIEGQRLAPAQPTWARLVSVRRNPRDYLFLRYRFTEPA